MIAFLCGFLVFKEIMWHAHTRELEKRIQIGQPATPAIDVPQLKTGEEPNTIADDDPTVSLEEAPNPFSRVTPRVPMPAGSTPSVS